MLWTLQEEDPLPLRKAKPTSEAALRRVEKEEKVAETKAAEATEKTEACKARLSGPG